MSDRVLAAGLAALCLLAGCDDAESVAPAPTSRAYAGVLSVDLRGASDTRLVVAPDGTLTLTMALDATAGQPLSGGALSLAGSGTVEAFPEASATLYTATFAVPASPDGLCPGQARSLGLSLMRREDNAHVGGSLTVYCGEGVLHGVPARVLRLSGDLR